MFSIQVNNFTKTDLLKELIDEFISPKEYEIDSKEVNPSDVLISVNRSGRGDINDIKRELYDALTPYVKIPPDWGILTGVRPVKLAGELIENFGEEEAKRILLRDYYLSEEKADLILGMYDYQIKSIGKPKEHTVSIYIGIPFCPTRCLYCAFASNQVEYAEIKKYLSALYKEIDYTAKELRERGIRPESLYIGGGTPTVLNDEDLALLMEHIQDVMDFSELREYTVEAGRPDTIDRKKLSIIKELGAKRISINPQSMIERTMHLIGRSHTPSEIESAFRDANEIGFDSINADLIAGLPEESIDDFKYSLEKIYELGAENITVHSLSVKRSSRLNEEDPNYHYRMTEKVRDMVKIAGEFLIDKGYKPYYLYRQKHMAGAAENTGYSVLGKEGLYNIRIIDEHQSNIALGAGAISKIYFPKENRLERIANVTNYSQYIDRIDEMIQRKKEGIFKC